VPALLKPSSFYTRWENIEKDENLHWQSDESLIRKHPLISRASENTAPMLIVAHEKDELIPPILPKVLHESLPKSDYVEVKGLGHSLRSATAAQIKDYEALLLEWLGSSLKKAT
jgi:pimeloyl-ACP methyl ester carboxylesterase